MVKCNIWRSEIIKSVFQFESDKDRFDMLIIRDGLRVYVGDIILLPSPGVRPDILDQKDLDPKNGKPF